MLHWTAQEVSGVCGSTGGGITLPPDFRGPNGERWRSAMLTSSPGGTPISGAPGLKLWVSNDTLTYTMYKPPGTKCFPPFHLCQACVICPSTVRNAVLLIPYVILGC